MKIQPCGMVLDFLPCCYEVQVKPFRDSDVAVGFKYYPAPPGAKTFPGWAFLNSRNWWEFHDQLVDLGEQSYNDRTNKFVPTPAGVDGQHFCGELDWFENGQPYDPSAPATEYNADGIALCCLVTKNKSVSGEGSPASLKSFYPPFMIGVCGEGSPRSVVTLQPPAVACGEAAPASLVATYAPLTGEVGGEASPASLIVAYAPLTGEVGGEASPASLVALLAVGQVGGEAAPASTIGLMPGVVGAVGGEASPASTIGLMPGVVGAVGGEASPRSVVTLSPVTPGGACSSAGTLPLSVSYTGTTPSGAGALDWFKFTATAGLLYTVHITGVTGPGVITRAGLGACPAPAPLGGPVSGNGNLPVSVGSTQTVWVWVGDTVPTGYTIQLTQP